MIVPATNPARGVAVESTLVQGDLSKLSSEERTNYYMRVCESLGLNPWTQPFEYITLNGKLKLYAKRDCADQLRKINGISVSIVSQDVIDDLLSVHVRATDKDARTDEDLGVVSFPPTLKGEARANAIMKGVTKAKRRVTLSISGLGFLDEIEVEDIPASAKRPAPPSANVMNSPPPPVDETGNAEPGEAHSPSPAPSPAAGAAERPAPSESPPPPQPEGAGTVSERLLDYDAKLATAAEQGMRALEAAWNKLPEPARTQLKAALERRHKPRAAKVAAK